MKINTKEIVQSIKKDLHKNTPHILTGIGIGGMVATTVLAVKATPKALDLLRDERDRQNNEVMEYNKNLPDESDDELYLPIVDRVSTKDAVKVAWRCYLPSVLLGTMSVVCLISASSVNTRRNAALATAYKLSETALNEYQDKVVELHGEDAHKEVVEAVNKDQVEKNPPSNQVTIIGGSGESLCYDPISGRYFKSSIDAINRAANTLNKYMFDNMYVSLNDFYDELGLDHVKVGDDLGWVVDKGIIEIWFSSQITEDNQACVVMNYDVEPGVDFDKAII